MILSKLKLVENIVNEISDNSTGQISPYDIRHNLLDIIDSIHLLTIGQNLSGSNFDTIPVRTTRIGEFTLENLGLQGYSSVDNSAIGYSALKSNYQGVRNTAVGSQALSCNIYGDDNVAIGHTALGSNTIGIGNVGVGSYSLNYNKGGNFNVAIGHGAGYYIDRNSSNKLFIASHPVNDEYICENPTGSGLRPLVYGDLSSLKFGIGVKDLDPYGTLQVGGDITPSGSLTNNIGHETLYWNMLYVQNIKPSNNLSIHGNLLPSSSGFNLGSSNSPWNSGIFDNIQIKNNAIIQRLVSLENANYFNKTITLANSGSIVAIDGGGPNSLYDYYNENPLNINSYQYLDDSQLSGAGFIVNSSGTGYFRNYSFTFLPPNESLSCLQANTPHAKSSWNSNISIHIASGSHLRTDRVIFPRDIALVSSIGCRGIFSSNSGLFISRENILASDLTSSSGHLAGIGNVNFLADSGNFNNYFVSFAALESGVTVGHRFLTGSKIRSKDVANNNKDRLNGFELKYIDDSSSVVGGFTDRFVIGSYNKTSEMVNAVAIMKESNDEGIFGISNIAPLSQNILPETSLNIRSKSNAVIRAAAENQANTKSSLQLLGGSNCLQDGLEIEYSNASGLADISMYKDSGKAIFFRMYENNTVGLFNNIDGTNAMLTIGDSGRITPAISIRQASFNPTSTANYGKIFVLPKIRTSQSQSLNFIDSSGNVHDLVINPLDVLDGRAVYSDLSDNTFVGYQCPSQRNNLLPNSTGNTSIGSRSLFNISTGDNNTVVGSQSASGLTTGSNNIVLGNRAYINSNGSNNIIIGNENIGSGTNSSYQLLIGASNSSVLLQGTLGPTNADKQLTLPSGGRLNIRDNTNTDSLSLRTGIIEVTDGGGNNYPDNTLSFKFTGNNSADILILNHNSSPLSNTASYAGTNRPFAQFNSDIRTQGFLRFSDGTSLNSAAFLNDVSSLNSNVSSINNALSSLLVEGYVPLAINPPSNSQNPTVGEMVTKVNGWQDGQTITLTNRDTTFGIHAGAYVIAIRINNEYRPIWINNRDGSGACCIN